MRITPFAGLTVLALIIASLPAHADNIVIYNTGLTVTGTLLGSGGIDPHYTLTSNPASGGTSSAYVTTTAYSGWTGNTGVSQWINPLPADSNNKATTVVNGEYDYATTFDLTGYVPTTARLSGKLAADDTVTDILINGYSTGLSFPTNSYSAFHTFNLGSAYSGDFISGLNTITFEVKNTANGPSGLQVQIAGTVGAPEPASYAAFAIGGIGLLGLGLKARKRQTVA